VIKLLPVLEKAAPQSTLAPKFTRTQMAQASNDQYGEDYATGDIAIDRLPRPVTSRQGSHSCSAVLPSVPPARPPT
jgi:hypothetical protein